MLVGERRNGNLLVQLAPKLQAQPEELLRQRWSVDGHVEYLIRWAVLSTEESGSGSSGATSQAENKSSNILMWMSAEEVYSNCPTLLGKRKPEGPGVPEEKSPGAPDEGALQEMSEDVRMLVQRAARQMSHSCGPDSSILNTIHVLSAYASIGSLAGVFKETGALDLLMKMLCNPEKQIRKNAGKMLRALASHDAGSRAHVLLSLSQQDGIEQHMDFESRFTLLQLFAETTSSEEHCISFDGIHLPQIPGKQLFSLVKRYLCVTSLLDQLSSDRPDREDTDRLQRQFDFCMAMGSLICELVRVMGWRTEGHPSMCRGGSGVPQQSCTPRTHVSSTCEDMTHTCHTLQQEMDVRMIHDPREMHVGDEGTFWQSGREMPPVQVDVRHILQRGKKTMGVTNDVAETPVDPASSAGCISHGDWWELLFFIRQLNCKDQKRVLEAVRPGVQKPDLLALLHLTVTTSTAQEVVRLLCDHCPSCLLCDLQNSHLYTRFCTTATSPEPRRAGGHPSVMEGDVRMSTLSTECGKSELQILNTLLLLEGLQLSSAEESMAGASSEEKAEITRSLESCRALVCHVRLDASHHEWKDGEQTTRPGRPGDGESGSSAEDSTLSEKMVKVLVEMLASQMKEKLVVVSCLQLTYVILSKYDWRVLFATEGGVRAVLGCMQEHQSSLAIQHIGLAVLKVLTGVGGCDLRGSTRRYNLNPGDAKMMKEIFSSIGSAASGSSTSLLGAIPGAICTLQGKEGCFTAVYNGLLVIRMLSENHEALSEQLSRGELPAVLQSITGDSNSMFSRLDIFMKKELCDLLKRRQEKSRTDTEEVGPVLALQDMDVASLLHSLKDARLCRELLSSLERCVCGDASSLPCDVSQLLTDTDFFLQLLSSLEQLQSEKQLQLCVFRILHGVLHLSREELFPWHESIRPSVRALTTHCSEKEFVQEVAHFLHSLASLSKDCAMLMCCLNTGEALKMVMERHGSDFQVAVDLQTLLKSYEEPAKVYKTISSSVLASCLQMILEQIDDQRRRHQQIRVPFFAVFLRSLGCESWSGKKEDKCWGKMEVSSNPHRASKLTDGNPKSYWESSGSTGSHYINIFMHRGVVIRQLLMVVASEDSSYMPARVLVMGGENASNISTELNAVNISSSTSRVVLLENATRFWPVVQVKIKRCQQGGIDTRVRGLEVLGPKPTFWPVFKEQLCRRTFLFYTSRAHSWGQEICEKKERLLQLFSRLNRALSHEQEFADRFLPDDEAAQALGRTCWEALISPLVRSITTSDSVGLSPLSWLLTRYLENIQSARRPKAQTSIFNSRVRRLTHLLVLVDTSPQDTAGLKSPSRTNGKSRDTLSPPVRPSGSGWSSVAGIAQCWQEVVRKQVQRFLEMSWNNVDLSPRICSMYRALRLAMDEMFGQQTQFLLSLRQGFCEGLLQLSFLTALHVTEQFARYIDQLITAIRADSSDLRALEQLQEFLDFILFLSDLELANSFEHFYRHYLADRLLSLGPCWLENTVVDHIGICFPNRFPQQMLKNLQEAKDLQKEEHLYRLQERDREVLSEENEEDEDQEEEMVVMEESPVLPVEGVEDSDVQIFVLSPRCWSISPLCYLTDPSKYLPETLGTPLLRFTDFYTRSQAVLGSDLAQSRRLQWTWLGNAEVQYGDLTLRVSTLQMFILLLFNQHQEVSMEDIKQHTGTSGSFLTTSLDSLTCSAGILSLHENTGCLRVNEAALRRLESQTVLDFSIRQNERRNSEEMIRALEKQRDLLSHVLERVMKDEREIHIDRLLFRVLDGFQREASVVRPGDCGVSDVRREESIVHPGDWGVPDVRQEASVVRPGDCGVLDVRHEAYIMWPGDCGVPDVWREASVVRPGDCGVPDVRREASVLRPGDSGVPDVRRETSVVRPGDCGVPDVRREASIVRPGDCGVPHVWRDASIMRPGDCGVPDVRREASVVRPGDFGVPDVRSEAPIVRPGDCGVPDDRREASVVRPGDCGVPDVRREASVVRPGDCGLPYVRREESVVWPGDCGVPDVRREASIVRPGDCGVPDVRREASVMRPGDCGVPDVRREASVVRPGDCCVPDVRREASFVRPGDCGVPDVLSCITRQLENGVIHRKPNKPWILCYKLEAPLPAPLCPLTSHAETITPIPPQVSEFCRVRKISSNIAPVPEQRPTFSTFKSME
ncbi:cullin-9-like [Phyllobates terribilis]|uniref:cullin-9-like n=1 Tax=Phyllobates terribilis TaxID=111132 RepID=UPI003CCB2AA6